MFHIVWPFRVPKIPKKMLFFCFVFFVFLAVKKKKV